MLEVLRELLPLVAFLYLVDAFVWVGAGGRLLMRRAGRRYRDVGSGLRPAALLPGDRAHLLLDLPLALTADGAFLPRHADATGAARWRREGFRFVPFDGGLELSAEHRILRIGGERALDLPSAVHAAQLADLLRELAAMAPGAERRRRIERQRALDTGAVAALAAEARRLPAAIWLFVALVFAVLPAAAVLRPEPWRVSVLVALSAAAWLGAAAASAGWARRLRELGGFVPKGAIWQLVYFPPSALHPAKPLLLDLYARCEPLAAAAALLPPEELAPLARRELAGAELAASEGEPAWREAWKDRAARIRTLLDRPALEAAAAAPAEAADLAAAAICPTCGGRYRAGIERCADCEIDLAPVTERG